MYRLTCIAKKTVCCAGVAERYSTFDSAYLARPTCHANAQIRGHFARERLSASVEFTRRKAQQFNAVNREKEREKYGPEAFAGDITLRLLSFGPSVKPQRLDQPLPSASVRGGTLRALRSLP